MKVVELSRIPTTIAIYSHVLLKLVVDQYRNNINNLSIVSTRARIKHRDVGVLAPQV